MFVHQLFSCPEQLNRWPCPLVPWSELYSTFHFPLFNLFSTSSLLCQLFSSSFVSTFFNTLNERAKGLETFETLITILTMSEQEQTRRRKPPGRDRRLKTWPRDIAEGTRQWEGETTKVIDWACVYIFCYGSPRSPAVSMPNGTINIILWEPGFMTIFVTWQSIVKLDSIRNPCDVFLPHYHTSYLSFFNTSPIFS